MAVADLPDKGDAAEGCGEQSPPRGVTRGVRLGRPGRHSHPRHGGPGGGGARSARCDGQQCRRPAPSAVAGSNETEWDHTIDVNLRAVFFGAQAAARHMVPQGSGRIINVASQLGVTGMPERAAYCASKGGVVNLTRALAVEWAPYGLTVNAVGPGPTDTPMVGAQTRATKAMLRARSPIGRRLAAEEIVGAVVFLASPAASGVNGHLLLVDGGWTAW